MYNILIVKYGEIGVKGKNRYIFEDALMNQIRFALRTVEGSFHVHRSQGRIYVECEGYYDYDETVEALKRVFGIVGICPVVHVEDKGFDELKKEVVDNIDTYSLEDIEAKLSILCVRNKVSFDLENDNKEADPISYNLNDTGSSNDNVPEWIKAIQSHVAEN